MTEQRKAMEQQIRTRGNAIEDSKIDSNILRSSQTKENTSAVKASQANSAVKKTVKKAFTEPLIEEKNIDKC